MNKSPVAELQQEVEGKEVEASGSVQSEVEAGFRDKQGKRYADHEQVPFRGFRGKPGKRLKRDGLTLRNIPPD